MRAYTYIDRSSAKVGNESLERAWSAFTGSTVALVDRPARFDWVGAPSSVNENSEFVFSFANGTFRLFDLGTIEWSEESDSGGATLVSHWVAESVDVDIRTFIFHDRPGMVRSITVTNKSSESWDMTRVVLDTLPFRSGVVFRVEPLPQFDFGADRVSSSEGVTAVFRQSGLLVVSVSPAMLVVKDTVCSIVFEAPRVLSPRQTLTFPPVMYFRYQPPFNLIARSHYYEFLRAVYNENLTDSMRKSS